MSLPPNNIYFNICFNICKYFLEDYYSKANSIFIEKGKNLDIKDLEEKLIDAGFEKTYMLAQRKEYSIRGDILDIFNINQDNPVRIEFFGNEVDRITYFDINSQLSIEKKDSIELYIDNNKKKKDLFVVLVKNLEKTPVRSSSCGRIMLITI